MKFTTKLEVLVVSTKLVYGVYCRTLTSHFITLKKRLQKNRLHRCQFSDHSPHIYNIVSTEYVVFNP